SPYSEMPTANPTLLASRQIFRPDRAEHPFRLRFGAVPRWVYSAVSAAAGGASANMPAPGAVIAFDCAGALQRAHPGIPIRIALGTVGQVQLLEDLAISSPSKHPPVQVRWQESEATIRNGVSLSRDGNLLGVGHQEDRYLQIVEYQESAGIVAHSTTIRRGT